MLLPGFVSCDEAIPRSPSSFVSAIGAVSTAYIVGDAVRLVAGVPDEEVRRLLSVARTPYASRRGENVFHLVDRRRSPHPEGTLRSPAIALAHATPVRPRRLLRRDGAGGLEGGWSRRAREERNVRCLPASSTSSAAHHTDSGAEDLDRGVRPSSGDCSAVSSELRASTTVRCRFAHRAADKLPHSGNGTRLRESSKTVAVAAVPSFWRRVVGALPKKSGHRRCPIEGRRSLQSCEE